MGKQGPPLADATILNKNMAAMATDKSPPIISPLVWHSTHHKSEQHPQITTYHISWAELNDTMFDMCCHLCFKIFYIFGIKNMNILVLSAICLFVHYFILGGKF